MSEFPSKPIPSATGLRPVHEAHFRGFLRNNLIEIVERYAVISRQSRVGALVALKIMAAELPEADFRALDCQ
jgi:hypothetical protein